MERHGTREARELIDALRADAKAFESEGSMADAAEVWARVYALEARELAFADVEAEVWG